MKKEKKTKVLVMVILLIVVAGLTVAFAALSATLNINGTAYLDAAKWGIKFENLSEPVKTGDASTSGTAKVEETKSAEITGINVSLSTPGDKVTYTVDLVNKGTINAKIDKIEKTELTSEQQKYLTFKITDKEGKEVSEGDILSAGETRNLIITIEFIKDLTKEDLPTSTSTISLSYKLNFVQTDDNEMDSNVTTTKSESHSSDSNPGDITNAGLYDGSEANPYRVESIEDLVSFSNDVENGNSYSNKYIILSQNIDFKESGSYVDSETIVYGDINEDKKVSGLKEEMTTNSGFNPIGNNTKPFKGTFDGNNRTISNLNIDRKDANYVGLFGSSSGIIKNLNLENVNIKGLNNVGGISGSGGSNASILHSKVSGKVEGNENVGGVIGSTGYVEVIANTTSNTNVVGVTNVGGISGNGGTQRASGVVQSGDVSGTKYVGGISGSCDVYAMTGGVYKSGNVSGESYVRRIIGGRASNYTNLLPGYAVKSTTVNGKQIEESNPSSIDGQTIDAYDNILEDINMAELVFDTYIGGDNDGDGYYWDYNEEKTKLVEKSVEENPLTFTLGGEGTTSSPYIINTKEELKQVNLKLNKVYQLNSDIDLTDEERFYVIGSNYNPFTGTFDGHSHEISNLSLKNEKLSFAGLFGRITGTVKNIVAKNMKINGNVNTGGLCGSSSGIIKNLNLENVNIKGLNNVGGISGSGGSNASILHSKVSGKVEGNENVGGVIGSTGYVEVIANTTSNTNVVGVTNVGGISGNGGTQRASGVVQSGDVSGTKYVGGISGSCDVYAMTGGVYKSGNVSGESYVRRIIGGRASNYTNLLPGYAVKSTTVNGKQIEESNPSSIDGQTIDAYDNILEDINMAELVFDTYIGGDNDGDGYYWDYNEEKTKLVEKSVEENPLTFTLGGEGTTSSPYIINTKEELKQVNLKLNKVYQLNSDIDLTDEERFYVIGSNYNPFTGTFDGHSHEISNLSLKNEKLSFAGLFGRITGTVKNIVAKNMKINGNVNTGGLCGSSTGSLINIKISSIVTGNLYVGGLTGYGNIANQVLVSSNVNGSNYVGCVGGYGGVSSGLCIKGNITGNSNVNRIYGASRGNKNFYAVKDNVLVNKAEISNAETNSNDGKDVEFNDLLLQSTYENLGFSFDKISGKEYWILENNELNLKYFE